MGAHQRNSSRASSRFFAVVTKQIIHAAPPYDLIITIPEDQLLLRQSKVAAAVKAFALIPLKSLTRGSANVEGKIHKTHNVSVRRVTFAPLYWPSRTLSLQPIFSPYREQPSVL
jgi:hypothetical protein